MADQEQWLEGQLPASVLRRLAEAVIELGEVEVQVGFFHDDQKRCRVKGQVAMDVSLECQRCMQPFTTHLEAEVQAAVVWSDSQARTLPAELDPWPADEDEGLALMSALEDELILMLPAMPVHPESECSGLARFSTGSAEETNKPFAGLRAALKDGDNH